jgi:hypothetical protein
MSEYVIVSKSGIVVDKVEASSLEEAANFFVKARDLYVIAMFTDKEKIVLECTKEGWNRANIRYTVLKANKPISKCILNLIKNDERSIYGKIC